MAFQLPSWFLNLTQQAHPDFQWFNPDEIELPESDDDELQALLAKWEYTEEQAHAAFELIRYKIWVGSGPTHYGMDRGIQSTTRYWLDIRDPSQLWVALDDETPPHLWFPTGQDLASIQNALAAYHHRKNDEVERNTFSRIFMGILEDTDLANLENILFMRPGFGGFRALGSAPVQNGANPRLTEMWSIQSRSFITLIWGEDPQVTTASIRYQPANQHETIARYNAAFGYHFPLDLPVDVAGLFLGFANMDAITLFTEMKMLEDESELFFYLFVLGNLLSDDLETDFETYIQPFANHPSRHIRGRVAEIAVSFLLSSRLENMLAQERDEELIAFMQQGLTVIQSYQ